MANMKSRSEDEDEERHSTDPESRDPKNAKKAICKVKWSRDEDEKLKKLVEQHGTDAWRLIANYFPSRTDGQCQHRWQKVLNPELVKGPWTKEEDQRVIELVHKYGPKRWSIIAKHLQGRIGKQCRERWHNHLNPEVKKSSWTQEEDRIIYEAHKRLGNRWAEISKLLPGRTDNSIKNHWNSTMRRKVEHEGYLQEGSRPYPAETGMKRRHKPCLSGELSHTQSALLLPGHTQLAGCPFGSLGGQCMDSIAEVSSYISPCQDDPEKEQRIKELELLLMAAETEVRRQAGARNSEGYSSWSDSLADETMATSGSLEEAGVELCGAEEGRRQAPPLHVSPSKFLAVEASAVLSTLHTIPEFAETMELIDSDPVAWSEVASFDVSEAGTPPKRTSPVGVYLPQGKGVEGMGYPPEDPVAIPELSRSCGRGSQGKPVPPCSSRFNPSPPSQPRRKRREGEEQSPADERNCGSFLDTSTGSPTKCTPVKSLPFSPSQFFNISAGEHLNLDNPALTSTPVCGQKCFNTPQQRETTPKHQKENAGFRTPKVRKSIVVPTPRTPTPFKNALAAQEKMHGPLKRVAQPLAFLEEDIREVLKEETGADIFTQTNTPTEYTSWKHQLEAPVRKVRKSLVLDACGRDCLNVQLFPHRQLVSSTVQITGEGMLTSSLLMAPPLEREVQMCPPSSGKDQPDPDVCPLSPRGQKVERSSHPTVARVSQETEWEAVVFGRTEDQLIMTEQARLYLSSPAPNCTPRALVL